PAGLPHLGLDHTPFGVEHIAEHHLRALPGGQTRLGSAHPSRPSADQRDLPGQSHRAPSVGASPRPTRTPASRSSTLITAVPSSLLHPVPGAKVTHDRFRGTLAAADPTRR